MRKAHSALFALSLALVIVPEIAAAGGAFVVAPGFCGFAYAGGYGYARFYGHPFDDGYDYPFGYGEYAEHGPWAYGGSVSGGCFLTQRRVRTAHGPRWRTVRVCN